MSRQTQVEQWKETRQTGIYVAYGFVSLTVLFDALFKATELSSGQHRTLLYGCIGFTLFLMWMYFTCTRGNFSRRLTLFVLLVGLSLGCSWLACGHPATSLRFLVALVAGLILVLIVADAVIGAFQPRPVRSERCSN